MLSPADPKGAGQGPGWLQMGTCRPSVPQGQVPIPGSPGVKCSDSGPQGFLEGLPTRDEVKGDGSPEKRVLRCCPRGGFRRQFPLAGEE